MRSCAAQVTDCGERIGEALEAANAGTAITENAFGKLLFFVPSLFLNAQASAVRGIQGTGQCGVLGR